MRTLEKLCVTQFKMASVVADYGPQIDLRLEPVKNSEVRQIIKGQKMTKRYGIRRGTRLTLKIIKSG